MQQPHSSFKGNLKIISVHPVVCTMHPSVHKRGRSDPDAAASLGRPMMIPGQECRKLDSNVKRSPGQDKAFEHITRTIPTASPLKTNSQENSFGPSVKYTPSLASMFCQRIRQLQKQLAEQMKINKILTKNDHVAKDQKIRGLETEMEKQEIAFKVTADLMTKVKDEKEILVRQKQSVVKENSEYRLKNTKLKEENSHLNSEINELKAQVEQVKTAKKTLRERIVQLNYENKELKKDIDEDRSHLQKVRGQRDAAEVEIVKLRKDMDKVVVDVEKMREVKKGQDLLAEELAKTNGKLQEVRNTRQRNSRAYKAENDDLKEKVTALEAKVAEKKQKIATMTGEIEKQNHTIQILVKEVGKRPDDSVIHKVKILQELSSTIWEMNHSYLKVFRRMGVAKNLKLMDVFNEMRDTVKRMTSPDFIMSKVDDDGVPNDLDIRLRKTKESLRIFLESYKEGRRELTHVAGVKRRRPSDGTSSMSDASDCSASGSSGKRRN
ncbi:cilia- and flagella-associated protein 58-like [Lineus longissimus]|uniref:cilia- and flagella-associated protein 58-like n=1 Tax=Lineus longissimus TaxID=88925 RepID=UPI002B4C4985